MNNASLIAIVIVAGGVVAEMYAIQQAGSRMEAENMLGQFASSRRASALCGEPDEAQINRYEKKLGLLKGRAAREMAEANPDASADRIAEMIENTLTTQRQEAVALIEAQGCDDMEVWKLVKRFEIYSR